jgi:hypothetical protein
MTLLILMQRHFLQLQSPEVVCTWLKHAELYDYLGI